MSGWNLIIGILILLASLLVIRYILPAVYIWLIEFRSNSLKRKLMHQAIITIDKGEGYMIHIPKAKEPYIRSWAKIEQIELEKSQSDLMVHLKDGTTEKMSRDKHRGWINLIRAVPEDVNTNQIFDEFKKQYFKDLQCCTICGKLALKDKNCLHCATEPYEVFCSFFANISSHNHKNIYQDEADYIKQQQKFWFTTYIANNTVEFHSKDILYENCKNWQPSVTADEVMQYEKDIRNGNVEL